ncbi:MAG TPA: long-chain fatty acid--CoA ligase [Polyangiaceae bacterium]
MTQPRFETLVDVFQESVESFPHRELFGTKKNGRWQWMTYREFGREVEKIRAGLASLGVQRGDHVAVISNNRPEWAVGAYASACLGAAYVPMYEAQLDKDWEFILRDCEAKILLVANNAILDKVRGYLKTIPSLQHIICFEGGTNGSGGSGITPYKALAETGKQVDPVAVTKEDVVALIYTSGTTGNPKGVILTHGNIASNVSAIHDVFPMEGSDRSLSFLPWAHVFGQTVELHGLFSMGASMAIAESVDKIIDNLAEVRPTLLFSVPRIFNKIYAGVQKQIASKPKAIQIAVEQAVRLASKERGGTKLVVAEHAAFAAVDKVVFAKVRAKFGGRLKYAFSGGAAISREVAEFIDTLGVTVYEGYGLTETSPIATANWPGERRIGSVGRAIPGVRVMIDTSGQPQLTAQERRRRGPTREEGEILVYGPNVMKGYYNRPEENAAVFTKDGGFRTGDMGYLDSSGYLYITGRIKEQYKLENGKYVVPSPLEEQLKLSPFVANAMVYGDNKPFNVALVVANVEAVKDWAEKNQLGSRDTEALLKDPKVVALFKQEISKHASHFKGFEDIRDFALISKDFTTENGMLTPSLKLKRRKVMEEYGKMVEALYAGKPKSKQGAPATA